MGQQGQRGPKTGVLLPVLFLGTFAGVPELHVHLVLQRLEHKKRTNSYETCGWKSSKEAVTTRQMTKKFPREVVSSLTRKVFLTQSAALSMQHKRSVEGALRAIGRTTFEAMVSQRSECC